ncbi:histidine kinase [Cryptobacterium curtum DSM 15641]|uniref:Sensor-like histidine kinase SenX3 n=1 Tax=Cryptobacterium curtum (strain ATCC 700683 / DSM 15641 / CCUG 43107 / 12-3) TaxID=469378 RepID=C7MME6_CRYCD|nr:HAMP domain-containing sensor histidine kinase [Cryptobacterium curtum]ACU94086.1 histidine kinase [Cryptobacterium curtum DSM 15641]
MGKRIRAAAHSFIASFRHRFVATSMVLAALVLVVVVVVVGMDSYHRDMTSITKALDHRVHDPLENPEGKKGPDWKGEGAPRDASSDQFVATSVFEVDTNGEQTAADDVLGLSSDVVDSALSRVNESLNSSDGSTSGFLGDLNLYYSAIHLDSGGMRVAFASGNFVMQNTMSLLATLGAVSAGALLAFFGISVLLARRATVPIERAWMRQQQFIADASHELKTPLTVIMANNSLIEGNPHDTVASQRKWLHSTDEEAARMQVLINDMLYLAKMEDDEQAPIKERVDFSETVQSTVLQFESVAFEAKTELFSEIDPDIFAEGDRARLQRLVAILLDNACKYAGPAGRVQVSLHRQARGCSLVVTNTGRPIDAADLPHLFDRFYRSDKARTGGAGGFGLGLAIAQRTVTGHGGRIAAESSAEAGTVFTVVLPCTR